MTKDAFIELIVKLINSFESLSLKLKSDMTPYQALTVIRDSGILSVLPDSMTFAVHPKLNGRLVVSSKYQSIPSKRDWYAKMEPRLFTFGELRYMPNGMEFMILLDATPETSETSMLLWQINYRSWMESDRYDKMLNMRRLMDHKIHVDEYVVNADKEKFYSVSPVNNLLVKDPCVLFLNESSAQSSTFSVPYEVLSDDLSEVYLKVNSKNMQTEDIQQFIRQVTDAVSAVHDVSIVSDETAWHVSCDCFTLNFAKDDEDFSYDSLLEKLTIKIAQLAEIQTDKFRAKIVEPVTNYNDSLLAS